jgi:hypothetical protein
MPPVTELVSEALCTTVREQPPQSCFGFSLLNKRLILLTVLLKIVVVDRQKTALVVL